MVSKHRYVSEQDSNRLGCLYGEVVSVARRQDMVFVTSRRMILLAAVGLGATGWRTKCQGRRACRSWTATRSHPASAGRR